MTIAVVGTLLVAAPFAGAATGSAVAVSDDRPNAAGAGATEGLPSPSGLRTSAPFMPCPDGPRAVSSADIAADVTLRADPPSAALCFTALFGLGAWQLGKSFRRINLAYVPEWYHAGGPSRIGSATALDPSFAVLPADLGGSPLVVKAVGERCPMHARRLRQQQFISIRCPRAPPVWQ